MRFIHVRSALRMVQPLGMFSFVFSIVTLLGYPSGIESFYRPLPGGPGTHPLTAVSIALLAFGAYRWRPSRNANRLPLLLARLALALGVARLIEIAMDVNMLSWLTPFNGVLMHHLAEGKPIATGANTAATVVLLALAMILAGRRHAFAAQFTAFLALAFPLVAITGYAYGLDKFYGRMALTTALAAVPAGLAILLANANRSVLRAVLSPWIGGRIARIQIALGYVVPFLIGYALLAIVVRSPAELFGIFVVLVSAFISALVTFTAVIQEDVDRARRGAERRLGHAATVDPLTGVPNRRMLMDYALREWERAQRSGDALCLLMLDVDHFKRVNDNCGHAVGDKVLVHIAALIHATLRSQDVVARFGGEEFVVVLPGTELHGAAQLAEKLRRRIEENPVEELAAAGLAATVSIGCAGSRSTGSFTDLIAMADAALYRAKAEGRNRVCLAEEESGTMVPSPAV